MFPLLDKIKANSRYLPPKDIKFADKFIRERNFVALLEIVESDIIKNDKKRNKDGLFENEQDDYLDTVYRELAGDLLSYISLIDPDYRIDLDEEDNNKFYVEDVDW